MSDFNSGIRAVPFPAGEERHNRAHFRRQQANTTAFTRPSPFNAGREPATVNNGEEVRFADFFSTNFTKGLPHNEFGFVQAGAYPLFVEAINRESDEIAGGDGYFDTNVPTGPGPLGFSSNLLNNGTQRVEPIWRNWESPRAGHVYDLEGPDADAVCMPPAPKLASDEMAVEVAEVYACALLRDAPFSAIDDGSAKTAGTSAAVLVRDLAKMPWFADPDAGTLSERARRRARGLSPTNTPRANLKAAFRGSTDGAMVGPYLSQFLLVGTKGRAGTKGGGDGATTLPGRNAKFEAEDGYIQYGTQIIDQRSAVHAPEIDYMTEWRAWLDVQNGINMKKGKRPAKGDTVKIQIEQYRPQRRFLTTPRDLASYVHFDQLYQAYMNACLIMLENDVPFSTGFPSGRDGEDITRGSFATFGGPHVLALLTEVSTRALRAVRRQKFNYHRRCRPEQIGALLTLVASDAPAGEWLAEADSRALLACLPASLRKAVTVRNKQLAAARADRWVKVPKDPDWLSENLLLPMAFPEGSPMHPSYGAGHATVAGACVTVLKAFFDMYEAPLTAGGHPDQWTPRGYTEFFKLPLYEADPDCDGEKLRQWRGPTKEVKAVTLQGELDKLAGNIAIGRNMAGVHFYTDYYDSLRMGERIAVGILQEQMYNYPERVTMRFNDFNGNRIMIQGQNIAEPSVMISPKGSESFVEADQSWWLCEPTPPRHDLNIA